MLRRACAALALGAAIVPAAASANSAAIDYFRNRASNSVVPTLLSSDEKAYYRQVFAAIDAGDWAGVQALLAQKPDGPLHAVARAEYFLAPTSPKIELDALAAWMPTGAGLPQAEQIAALAAKRGGALALTTPAPQRLVGQPAMPRRVLPRSVNDGTMPAAISAQILDRIKNDDPMSARVLLDGIDAQLSPQARAEWRQRVAWSFFIGNDPAAAYALAQTAAEGAGSWVAEGWWTAGLAAFRLDDCQGASDAFARVAQLADNPELTAAGHYWNARALIRCRRPEAAAAPLRLAAARDETLYGMLAAEQLGMKIPETHAGADFTPNDWASLRDTPAVRAAVALVEIGRDGLADEVLRYQARIGGASQYQPLSRLARDLGLPSTQLWMAYNTPVGARAEPAARFPTPKWTPSGGWKVDPALVYAHTLQESVFRTDAVSPAGARGLMQIMPAAARDRAAAIGVAGSASDLARPEVNLAFGQEHLIALRDNSGTQGLLPKVIAAFNAGPAPVSRWNSQVRDGGDPLLWIESLPYWETRGYVNIVLRNYWMYERQAGGPSESRTALAEGLWPTFPGLSGSKAVRLSPDGSGRAR
ncbi:lytic transglycosylase domain-containing protein [Parablastomonas sp. CN1-191]|uniref:lytic transglycosylase domain-containing protein n=1 Tax=Parablastomonas sp. CN1-191 TaxID=3400908 RepID=UPI003BF7C0C0